MILSEEQGCFYLSLGRQPLNRHPYQAFQICDLGQDDDTDCLLGNSWS